MIKQKTVVVLGAGASAPYGLPTGFRLRQLICENDASNPFLRVSGAGIPTSTMSAKLEKLMDIPEAETFSFIEAFKRSNVGSIDAFLARRKNFETLGKLIIAFQLCRHEHHSMLYEGKNDDDWYHALWNAMVDNIETPQELINNQLRIISFNYDRSLEYFLHQATVHTFGLNDETAQNILRGIDILHPYGVLGNFDPSGTVGGRQYSVDLSKEHLNIAAAGIQIIPEARDDAPAFERARDWFSWANQICFLGFGFDPLNVKRLGLSGVLDDKRELRQTRLRVVASTHGRTDAEVDQIRAMLGVHPTKFSHFQEKSLLTIRKSGILAQS
ncbi:MAG: hypothetical protein K0M48_08810 [Thiobacillus sp.]|nr:hypothetical protein [Thiobacillus sp.]